MEHNSDSHAGDPLSETLAEAELCEEIEKWSATILKRAGETLFRQGEGPGYAFFVKTGEIALTMSMSGGRVWNE